MKKSLHGLKQVPRKLYKKFDYFMENYNFHKIMCDYCVFVKKFGDNDFIILLLYVVDILIDDQDASKIDNLKRELNKSFATKDLGPPKQILGIKISHDRKSRKLWLSQEVYVKKVLERFNKGKAKSVCPLLVGYFKFSYEHYPISEKEKLEMKGVPYASAISSLMYVMVNTRPDIVHAIGLVNRFFSNSDKEHWTVVK